MYIPQSFRETRPEEIEKIMTDFPLGTLVYQPNGALDATHLPFVYKKDKGEQGVLLAHVARNNPIWQQIPNETEVLIVFHGNDAYISPNWYPTKHETHRHVPTWDYQVVHVRGRIRFIDDVKFLRASVALLTHIHEKRAGEPKPWKLSDGDKEYISEQLAAIIGVEIAVTDVVGVSKLSQNREQRDWNGVVEGLRNKGEHCTAEAVLAAKRKP